MVSCNQISTKKGNLNYHTIMMPRDQKLQCEVCDFETPLKRYLATHQKSMHQGQKFQCPDCDYEATRKDTGCPREPYPLCFWVTVFYIFTLWSYHTIHSKTDIKRNATSTQSLLTKQQNQRYLQIKFGFLIVEKNKTLE